MWQSENQLKMNRKLYSATVTLTSVSLAALLISVWSDATNSIDTALSKWALGSNTPNSVSVWQGVSLMGSTVVLGVLTALSVCIFVIRHDWRAVKLIATTMGGSVLLNNSIKWLVQRPRPEEIYAHTMPSSFSFPAGSAVNRPGIAGGSNS